MIVPHSVISLSGKLAVVVCYFCFLIPQTGSGADHNDPNAINSIFGDVETNPADLYDLYGFPSDDTSSGEKVVIALTFASVPATGVFDPDMLYRVLISPNPRIAPPIKNDATLEAMLRYFDAIKDKYLGLKPSEVRVTVGGTTAPKSSSCVFQAGVLLCPCR